MATTIAPKETTRDAKDDDILDVWQRYKTDSSQKDLRNRLVERYLPLVRYNGERIWSRLPEGVELDDLISAGVFGLMDAIDAFDLSRGVKFETYCVPRIRGAMLDELRTMDWVPRLVRRKASKLNEAIKNAGSQAWPAAHRKRVGRVHADSASPELEKMILDANAVNLISLNKKWYETDSYKDVREIDILEDKKGEDPTRRIQKNDLMRLVTKGPQSQRAADHHSLLLRRTDDEGDRRHARSQRKPRQPDAQQHRAAAAEPTRQTPTRIRHLTCGEILPTVVLGARPTAPLWHGGARSDVRGRAASDVSCSRSGRRHPARRFSRHLSAAPANLPARSAPLPATRPSPARPPGASLRLFSPCADSQRGGCLLS